MTHGNRHAHLVHKFEQINQHVVRSLPKTFASRLGEIGEELPQLERTLSYAEALQVLETLRHESSPLDERGAFHDRLVRLAAQVSSYEKQLRTRLGTAFAAKIRKIRRTAANELRENLQEWNDTRAAGEPVLLQTTLFDTAKGRERWSGKDGYWVVC